MTNFSSDFESSKLRIKTFEIVKFYSQDDKNKFYSAGFKIKACFEI